MNNIWTRLKKLLPQKQLKNAFGKKLPVMAQLDLGFFALALFIFWALINFHVVGPAAKYDLPDRFAGVEQTGKITSAELEHMLRDTPAEVAGLVIIDPLGAVVVQHPGTAPEQIVTAGADVQEAMELAKSAKTITVETAQAAVESAWQNLPNNWWAAYATFILWFGWLMVRKRGEYREDPPRFSVLFAALDEELGRRGVNRTKFLLTLVVALIALNAVGYFTLYHEETTVPPRYISAAERIDSDQAALLLKSTPDKFRRVVQVPGANMDYLDLYTTPGNADDIRSTVFPTADKYEAFNARLKQAKIKTSVEDQVSVTWGDLTGRGKLSLYTLSALTLLAFTTLALNWTGGSLKGQMAMAGIGHSTSGGSISSRDRTVLRRRGAAIRDQQIIHLEDVAGQDDGIAELRRILNIYMLANANRALGVSLPNGVAIFGPPGVGKTLSIRALAEDVKRATGKDVYVEIKSGGSFVDTYVGRGSSRIRDWSNTLRQMAIQNGTVSIGVIDEADALLRTRANGTGDKGDQEYDQTVNTVLEEMDSADEDKRGYILWIILSNNPKAFDEAVLRQGRVDVQLYFKKPTEKGRRNIFAVWLSKRLKNLIIPGDTPAEQAANYQGLLDRLAKQSPQFSGASIAGAVNRAAIVAAGRVTAKLEHDIPEEEMEAWRDLKFITFADVLDAVDWVGFGAVDTQVERTREEEWLLAIQKWGHLANDDPDKVNFVTLQPTHLAGAGVHSSSGQGHSELTQTMLRDRITLLLGGYAALRVIFGEVSAAVKEDLDRAGLYARQMVGWGLHPDFPGQSLALDKNGFPPVAISEWEKQQFSDAWRKEIRVCLERAEKNIKKYRAHIVVGARALLEKKKLDGEAVRAIWAGVPESELDREARDEDKVPPPVGQIQLPVAA